MRRVLISLIIAAIVAKAAYAAVRYIMTGREMVWLLISAACFFMLLTITVPT